MDPDLMKAAQAAMKDMPPEKLAALQSQATNYTPEMMQQAMRAMEGMSPEQIKEAMEKMKGMSEEDLRRGASAARTQAAGTSTYLVNGAKQLKEEGNRLVSEGKWRDAREKYERAISNLLGMTSAEASLLRVQCTLNNALCFLKTADFGACIQECDSVLRMEPQNGKALARRGHAKAAQKDFTGAVADLQRACRLFPNDETLAQTLEDARQQLRESGQAEPPPLSETPDDEGEIETVYTPGGVATATAAAMASSGGAKAPADSSQLRAAAEAMKRDPEMARAQMEMLANMTQEQIDAMLQASGQTLPDGQKLTPELARTIADQFKGMTPEQMEAYARMAEMMQQEAGPSGAGGSPGAGFEAGSAKMQEMMNDPAMRSMAMSSLKNMTPDQFRSLSGALGKGMSDDQITQLLSQLQGMDDTQLERLMRVAGWTQWGLKMLKRYALVLVLLFLGAALLLGYSIKWLLRKNPSAALAEDPAVVSAVEAPVDVAGGDAALGGVGSADGFVSDEM